jgi:hypothetical protein
MSCMPFLTTLEYRCVCFDRRSILTFFLFRVLSATISSSSCLSEILVSVNLVSCSDLLMIPILSRTFLPLELTS